MSRLAASMAGFLRDAPPETPSAVQFDLVHTRANRTGERGGAHQDPKSPLSPRHFSHCQVHQMRTELGR